MIENSTAEAAPLSPDERRTIKRILTAQDPALADKYERAEREREQGLDIARTMLVGSHVETFAGEFRKTMDAHASLAERMAVALHTDAAARLKEAENAERRFMSLWGPKGTLIGLITVLVTNVVTVIATLWATGQTR